MIFTSVQKFICNNWQKMHKTTIGTIFVVTHCQQFLPVDGSNKVVFAWDVNIVSAN